MAGETGRTVVITPGRGVRADIDLDRFQPLGRAYDQGFAARCPGWESKTQQKRLKTDCQSQE